MIIEGAGEIQARQGNVARRFAAVVQICDATFSRACAIALIASSSAKFVVARDMLEAAATGHSSGFSTIHDNSCDEELARLARLAECISQDQAA